MTERASEREQAAAYVESLAEELVAIARCHRLDTLAYLLDMARLEARGAQRHRES